MKLINDYLNSEKYYAHLIESIEQATYIEVQTKEQIAFIQSIFSLKGIRHYNHSSLSLRCYSEEELKDPDFLSIIAVLKLKKKHSFFYIHDVYSARVFEDIVRDEGYQTSHEELLENRIILPDTIGKAF